MYNIIKYKNKKIQKVHVRVYINLSHSLVLKDPTVCTCAVRINNRYMKCTVIEMSFHRSILIQSH